MTSPKSIFEHPKKEWRPRLKTRAPADLVQIDFPHALSMRQIEPMRLLLNKILKEDTARLSFELTEEIEKHIKTCFEKDKDYPVKTWLALTPFFSYFVPTKTDHAQSVQKERRSPYVTLEWFNGYPKNQEGITLALKDPEKNGLFLESLNTAAVRLVGLQKDLDFGWISFLDKETKQRIAKSICGEALGRLSMQNDNSAVPTLFPSLKKNLPELEDLLTIGVTKAFKDGGFDKNQFDFIFITEILNTFALKNSDVIPPEKWTGLLQYIKEEDCPDLRQSLAPLISHIQSRLDKKILTKALASHKDKPARPQSKM